MSASAGFLVPRAQGDRQAFRRRLFFLILAGGLPFLSGLGLLVATYRLMPDAGMLWLASFLLLLLLPGLSAWHLADLMARRLAASFQAARTEVVLADVGASSAVIDNRLALLGRLAASLVREVRQPLAAIAGYSAAAGYASGAASEVRALLRNIDLQVERAGALLSRVSGFARQQGERSPLELAEVVSRAVDWAAEEARRFDIVLDPMPAPREMPRVMADPVQLEQVLLNLLHNAFDAITDSLSHGPRRVEVGWGRTGDDGLIWVRDSGAGVPAQMCDQLFQPFFTTKETGHGLGLTVSRAIVESHGGRMWHVPGGEGGCCFYVALPLMRG